MATIPAGDPDPIAAWRSMLLAHSRALRAIESELAGSPRYVLPVAQVPTVLPLLHSGDIVAMGDGRWPGAGG